MRGLLGSLSLAYYLKELVFNRRTLHMIKFNFSSLLIEIEELTETSRDSSKIFDGLIEKYFTLKNKINESNQENILKGRIKQNLMI